MEDQTQETLHSRRMALCLALAAVFVVASPLTAQICAPTNTVLQFDGGYGVSMCYTTPTGAVGQAKAGIWSSGESGLLWFFDPGNAEVLVKVLDACAVPPSQGGTGHRWVFVAPVTTLGFNLRITGPGGQVWTHTNRQGRTASTRSDLYGFSCSRRPPAPVGFDLAPVNSDPRGITYANGRFFVVDWLDERVYAYNATTRRRDPARDFNLHPSNVFPEGITHWNGYLFVVDNLGEVYAYEADTGRHEPAFDFTLAFENADARGIADAALDETDYFFVVDWTFGNENVYVYDAFSGNWQRSNDFSLADENAFPEGISFADPGGGGVLLVADSADEKAYAYGLRRRPSADVNFSASNADPRGIVQFNGVVYVVDGEDSYVYAYAPYGTAASQNDSAEPLLSASGSEEAVAKP